ncbi:MAG: hypothetical protein H8D42_03590 [Candidatus Marinimicrobia bacterium]|nr:hypothetical protein [Candidatus Neomarinimicrobiota bacterium]MBL7204006.1 hypothetical protein [Desulfobacteraceae bacterium]
MNNNFRFDSKVNISAALTWLHRELRHIRFIYSSFVVISALTFVFTIISPSVDKELFAEINKLIPFINTLKTKADFLPDQIEKITPTIENCPETYVELFISAIPEDQLIKIIPIEFTQEISKMKLIDIRDIDKKPLFKITQINT